MLRHPLRDGFCKVSSEQFGPLLVWGSAEMKNKPPREESRAGSVAQYFGRAATNPSAAEFRASKASVAADSRTPRVTAVTMAIRPSGSTPPLPAVSVARTCTLTGLNADLIATDKPLRVVIDVSASVSALLRVPSEPLACYVLAHGAGAGMTHRFLQAVSDGLAERRIATLRYQFPSVERGSKRPDSPAVAHAAVRAACRAARDATGLPLVAGGKSFGGRMTSQAEALSPLPNVAGLAFLGFPLHAPDKPSSERARHLFGVKVPMLFVQGTRDKLADFSRMTQVVAELGPGSTLLTIDHADHGFDVLVRSGRTPDEVMSEVLDGLSAWIGNVV